jgi:superoxide reductase
MTELRELYHCNICGNVVEVVSIGATSLVCCGEDMTKLETKSGEEGREKHKPVTENTASGVLVKVGSVEHPMTPEHHIDFIEVLTPDKVLRAELKPGAKPQAEFRKLSGEITITRAYCNIHGLWKE